MTLPTADRARLALTAMMSSVAAFLYFHGLSAFIGGNMEPISVLGRGIAALVIGTSLSIRVQREMMTTVAAAKEGLVLAIIVVVSTGLFGSEPLGQGLAVRSAGVLLGLPLLAVLTRAFGQKRTEIPSGQ